MGASKGDTHGLDNAYSHWDLHRAWDQRLSADRIL